MRARYVEQSFPSAQQHDSQLCRANNDETQTLRLFSAKTDLMHVDECTRSTGNVPNKALSARLPLLVAVARRLRLVRRRT